MLITSYTEVNCIVSDYLRWDKDADQIPSKVWSLSFKPDHPIESLFPYINGVMDEALWYERPNHVRMLFKGLRCILYPERVASHFFDSRAEALDFIRPLIDFLNQIHEGKSEILPNAHQIRHVQVLDIFRILPRTNCRECGFSSCMALAAAVARGRATAGLCPDLSPPVSENAVYPVFDDQGRITRSVSLQIDTAGLKQRIQDQHRRIQQLEARPETASLQKRSAPEPKPAPKPYTRLTDREIEVLALIAKGYTNNEIARLLFISPHTVKSHMINIFNKFAVSDRTQAAVLGVRSGLI